MQYVTRQESSQTYCSVRVVANIIMRPAWRLVPRPSSGQDGSAQSVKCARHAGVSSVQILCLNIASKLQFSRTFTFCILISLGNQEKIPKCWYVMPVIRATTPSVSSQLWIPFPLTPGSVE